MFDYRYHALSLAAVLIALAVGVLLGVAIGDANLVSSAKSGVVRSLRSDVSGVDQTAAQLRDQVAQQDTFENELFPIAVGDTLAAKNIGLIFLGGSRSDQVTGPVRQALTAAGAQLAMVGAVREPLDLAAMAASAAGTRYGSLDTPGSTQLTPFGRRIGIQLVQGGSIISRLRDKLFSSFTGRLGRLDGVIIVREQPSGLLAQQTQDASEFETGLISGIDAVGAPAVGTELTSTVPSQVPWYRSQGISSVDDVDNVSGRTALDLALGGDQGTFGIKPTADAQLPAAVNSAPPAP